MARRADDTDFRGLPWREVFRQLLKWLASGFQFGSFILRVLSAHTSSRFVCNGHFTTPIFSSRGTFYTPELDLCLSLALH